MAECKSNNYAQLLYREIRADSTDPGQRMPVPDRAASSGRNEDTKQFNCLYLKRSCQASSSRYNNRWAQKSL